MDAKSLREAMKEKAKRLSGATSEKVDASTFTPAEPLNADVKTGARPVSRRAFKVGGKVQGAEAMSHAGRTPRKSGGKSEYANALVNRNVKDANEEREGKKHVGGFKKGGRTGKMDGGEMSRPMPRPSREMMDEMNVPPMTRPKPRPSPERMREIMDAAEAKKYQDMLDMAARSGDGYARGGTKMKKAAERDIGEMMAEEEMPSYKAKRIGRKAMKDMPTADMRKKMGDDRSMERGALMPSMHDDPQLKRGGKAEKFEGSAKDEMQDKKLAAKRGMSMKEWEASKADEKHDKQESMKGLKSGGRAEKMGGGSTGYATGGKMKMVEKNGKKVPFFAADGVGKMAAGGGLYANIHAKRERIEHGSKEKMRDAGDKGAPSSKDFKDAAKTAKKDGGKAMHHKDCMCKACGGAAMSDEGGRMARKSGGKVGKSNISINIFPHTAEKAGAMPVPPAGMSPMMKPPMPMPAPAPMPSAPPPAHMSIPPGLQQAMAGAAGAGPMPPAGGAMPQPMMNRPPMPAPMMGRKAGGRVAYPITGGAGGGRARKEKVAAYGEKMNQDLKV